MADPTEVEEVAAAIVMVVPPTVYLTPRELRAIAEGLLRSGWLARHDAVQAARIAELQMRATEWEQTARAFGSDLDVTRAERDVLALALSRIGSIGAHSGTNLNAWNEAFAVLDEVRASTVHTLASVTLAASDTPKKGAI